MLLVCLLSLQGLVAQNLIPNGSFETYTQCPQRRNDGITSSNWNTPTKGTSDYFNICAPTSGGNGIDVPNNFGGSQSPRTGNAYAGIYASMDFSNPFLEYREYMQVTLDSLLVAGGKYTFTMYLSLGDKSNYASNKMGAYISQTRPTSNTDTYLNVEPQILTTTYITDKTNWVRVTGEYTAVGGEKYITIGVFEPAATHTRISVSGGDPGTSYEGVSYYYIDDVILTRSICDITPNPLTDTAVCIKPGVPLFIAVNDTINHSYLWSTGATTKSINAALTGKYILNISSNLCSVYDTITVTRKNIPVVNLGPDLFICGDVDTLLRSANAGISHLWNTGAVTENIQVFNPGVYSVEVTDKGCKASDTLTVFASIIPALKLNNDTGYCFQTNIVLKSPLVADTYLWSTGSNQSSVSLSKAGTYWLQITKGYCTVRDSIRLSQKIIPVLDLGPDRKVCKEQSVQIDLPQAVGSYVWQDGSQSSVKTVQAPGVFAVTVTSDDGCSVTDSLQLDTFISPVINLGADTFICKNTELLLGVNGMYTTYKWQDGSTMPTFNATSNASYSLEVTDLNGCVGSDQISLQVYSLPDVNLLTELKICEPDTFVEVTGSFNQLLWDDGSSLTHYPIKAYGSFTVTVTDTNECSNKATITVVNNCPGIVFVPNVFTPSNRDGINDVFYPITRNIESMVFQIYNRWGEKVFETNTLLEGWTGTFDGAPVQADVYVYTVQYKAFSGVVGSASGNVTVLK